MGNSGGHWAGIENLPVRARCRADPSHRTIAQAHVPMNSDTALRADSMPTSIHPALVYESIRDEILDQKRCQFQIFTVTATLAAAIIGLAAKDSQAAAAYIGPALMAVLALFMIFEKAISIQRKVGYLQLMERH